PPLPLPFPAPVMPTPPPATTSFFFSSRRRHTRFKCDWSSDVCSSDLGHADVVPVARQRAAGRLGRLVLGRNPFLPGLVVVFGNAFRHRAGTEGQAEGEGDHVDVELIHV